MISVISVDDHHLLREGIGALVIDAIISIRSDGRGNGLAKPVTSPLLARKEMQASDFTRDPVSQKQRSDAIEAASQGASQGSVR